MNYHSVKIDLDGREYSLETGRFAKFAGGAVMVQSGDTMVLVTVTRSKNEIDADFLPLQVEYREKTAAAGKIPGGFLKREGRPSDKEVLTARLIDRPIRPMLPKSWRFETQIVAGVYSAEPDVNPDTLSAVGASAALMLSDIPFNGPISQVRVARIDGEFVVNPGSNNLDESDMDISVSGSDNAIMMVEGETKEISEDDFLAALEFAHEKIKELNGLQHQLAELVSTEKIEVEEKVIPEEIVNFVTENVTDKIIENVHSDSTKAVRSEQRSELRDKIKEDVQEKFGDNEDEEYVANLSKWTGKVVDEIEKTEMRKMILKDGKRLDGRSTTDIRPIECEVGLLPRTHGSALFTRGETQSLSTVTLGTDRDEQMIDGLLPVSQERFMLHYNFPPFSVGETGRMGLSRREIGHGHLAWRALKEMLPTKAEFPYTIRIVSDILESNGSSSMATVCAGSMGMFDAGVPFKKSVAGIAMGLIKEEDDVAILSDILGDEDFLGDMDFKVAGTKDGITACQMDIKIEGLSIEIMKNALEQAKAGRMHILGIMDDTINAPREEISEYAPQFETMKIPSSAIGSVIGSGGETIRSICKETNTEVNIEDDGTVVIAATSREESRAAREMIEQIIKKPEVGEIYEAKVIDVREGLGAIVEVLPKSTALLHISQIAWEKTENVGDVLSVGDTVEVKLTEVGRDGKMKVSRKALLPKPEGYVEREPRRRDDRRDDRRGDDRRGNDRRGGGDRRGRDNRR
jgi:polyribonucleotide nucleotidyltransferase